MSCCGTCGGFYNEKCARWPACQPAPNPHDGDLVVELRRMTELLVHIANNTAKDGSYIAISRDDEQHPK